ncbi:MAG: hypothetical protein ACJAXH_002848 [Colwellia sp.]|jgi:hypothetical protein
MLISHLTSLNRTSVGTLLSKYTSRDRLECLTIQSQTHGESACL